MTRTSLTSPPFWRLGRTRAGLNFSIAFFAARKLVKIEGHGSRVRVARGPALPWIRQVDRLDIVFCAQKYCILGTLRGAGLHRDAAGAPMHQAIL